MRALIAALVLVLAVGAFAPVGAVAKDGFKAKNLFSCVGFTEQDWNAAPEGSQIPFAGVRVYARDGQRGRSLTYCLTATAPGLASVPASHGPAGDWEIKFPKWLRRNAESLRIIAAPGCRVFVEGFNWKGDYLIRRLGNANGTEVKRRDRGIPERLDDRLTGMVASFACGEALA